MKKTLFTLLGILSLITAVGIILSFESGSAAGLTILILLVISSDLLIVGGMRESISIGSTQLMWHHLVGSGIIVAGLSFAFYSLYEAIISNMLFSTGLLGVLASVTIIFIGADFIRGGVHFNLNMVN